MAFQFAVSVSHNDMEKELWANRMAESGIGAFEYSCGGFPEIRDLRNKIAFLTPYLQEGKFSFPSVHLPAWFTSETPGQANDFERDMCIRRLANFIENAAPLGMKNLTLHSGIVPEGQTREEAVAAVRDTLQRLAVTAEKYGMSLNLELCPIRSVANHPDALEQIMQDMPDCVGVCFDVNHAGVYWEEVPRWIAQVGKYIRTFHISDCDEYGECHWMPGTGVLDWEAIMKEIRKLNKDFLFVYEIVYGGFSPPAQKREMDPKFFFKAVKANMEWLDTLGK